MASADKEGGEVKVVGLEFVRGIGLSMHSMYSEKEKAATHGDQLRSAFVNRGFASRGFRESEPAVMRVAGSFEAYSYRLAYVKLFAGRC
jgi:hypothetical protein